LDDVGRDRGVGARGSRGVQDSKVVRLFLTIGLSALRHYEISPLLYGGVMVTVVILSISSLSGGLEVVILGINGAIRVAIHRLKRNLGTISIVFDIKASDIICISLRVSPANTHPNGVCIIHVESINVL
jgi:hypothetical protein